MFKAALIITLIFFSMIVHAQMAEKVYDRYLDFNLARLQGEHDKALDLGEQILVDTAELTAKAHASFFNGLAKLYEQDSQDAKAVIYYQKVVVLRPDYYVAHRALGYLYVKGLPLHVAQDFPTDSAYVRKVRLALNHLEKAQACDPDESTLQLIKKLYQNISEQAAAGSLPVRLKALSKNCADILSDQ